MVNMACHHVCHVCHHVIMYDSSSLTPQSLGGCCLDICGGYHHDCCGIVYDMSYHDICNGTFSWMSLLSFKQMMTVGTTFSAKCPQNFFLLF